MSCTEFEDDLRRYYLGEEDDKPKASEYIKMQTHIRSCTTCSVNSEKLKAMQAAINGIVKQKTSATFYDTLSEKLPKPSPVTIYMNQIKRKFAKVPRPVWIGGFSLVTIFIIFMLVKIFFPSFGLPVIYYYGDVDIRKSTDNSGLKKLSGYPVLSVGDKLKTDSSSSVVFVIAKNTSARMGENTDLRIGLIQRSRDEGYTCKLDVVSGNLWVSQIAGESKFEK
ncbi:MAG TPA: hypothetical protein PL110_10880, partial [Candidatus Eremiobacteraeota bacterium]|nr:hypothetical protein [Candidatus Eremiobacteraeota bacterium]